MMEQPAVIEDADGRHKGRADQDTGDLFARGSLKRQQDGNHDGSIHRQPTQKRNGCAMNLARPRQVDHADAQCKCAHGNDQHHRSE